MASSKLQSIGGCDCKVAHRCHFCNAVEVPTSEEPYGEPVCAACIAANRDANGVGR